jgi:AcrR family transcriptional regulator
LSYHGTPLRDKVPYSHAVARWQPDAPARLVQAALDLFEEQGYDQTTVVQIAQRAGLTKSTFFRHFRDKREVLFGGDTLAHLLDRAVSAAPSAETPLEAGAHALRVLGQEAFTPDRRAFTARRAAVIAGSPELREREALKGLSLSGTITDALRRRGASAVEAELATQLCALAWKIALGRWIEPTNRAGFGEHVATALREVLSATTSLRLR